VGLNKLLDICNLEDKDVVDVTIFNISTTLFLVIPPALMILSSSSIFVSKDGLCNDFIIIVM
jgi:hypothetical protein